MSNSPTPDQAPLPTPKQRSKGRVNGGLTLEPAFDFLRTLWLLNHRLESTSKNMMNAIGVTGPQRMLLRIVGSNPGIAAGALAGALHVSPGTLSTSLRRLQQRELIVRTPDPGDRRRILITLTRAGRRLDKPIPHTVESGIRTALAELSPRQISVAQRVLASLASHLSAPGKPG